MLYGIRRDLQTSCSRRAIACACVSRSARSGFRISCAGWASAPPISGSCSEVWPANGKQSGWPGVPDLPGWRKRPTFASSGGRAFRTTPIALLVGGPLNSLTEQEIFRRPITWIIPEPSSTRPSPSFSITGLGKSSRKTVPPSPVSTTRRRWRSSASITTRSTASAGSQLSAGLTAKARRMVRTGNNAAPSAALPPAHR